MASERFAACFCTKHAGARAAYAPALGDVARGGAAECAWPCGDREGRYSVRRHLVHMDVFRVDLREHGLMEALRGADEIVGLCGSSLGQFSRAQ